MRAARGYLASREGLRVSGDTLSVSSIFKWYGDDFIAGYAGRVSGTRPPGERAVLGAIAAFGPPAAAATALTSRARVRFLDYDWSLNDVERPARGVADSGLRLKRLLENPSEGHVAPLLETLHADLDLRLRHVEPQRAVQPVP